MKITFLFIIAICLEYSTQILTKGQKHCPKHRTLFSRASEKGIFQNQEIFFSFDSWLLFEIFKFQRCKYASLMPTTLYFFSSSTFGTSGE